jgi:hypothetical protein
MCSLAKAIYYDMSKSSDHPETEPLSGHRGDLRSVIWCVGTPLGLKLTERRTEFAPRAPAPVLAAHNKSTPSRHAHPPRADPTGFHRRRPSNATPYLSCRPSLLWLFSEPGANTLSQQPCRCSLGLVRLLCFLRHGEGHVPLDLPGGAQDNGHYRLHTKDRGHANINRWQDYWAAPGHTRRLHPDFRRPDAGLRVHGRALQPLRPEPRRAR